MTFFKFWLAVVFYQLLFATIKCFAQDHFHQVGEFFRKSAKFGGVSEDVAHVDAEHLTVFEGV